WRSPLPLILQDHLQQHHQAALPRIVAVHASRYDGSRKFICELADGQRIECVLMPEKRRLTLCLSSQVGCAQGCVFCHTGRMGLRRNLDAHEIVGQLRAAEVWMADNPQWLAAWRLPPTQRISNIV